MAARNEPVTPANPLVIVVKRGFDVPAERIIVAPDCGMKYLPAESAFGNLQAMTQAAAQLRGETAG